MTSIIHHRPDLQAEYTDAPRGLLNAARGYRLDDGIFEVLYRHAADLEAKLDADTNADKISDLVEDKRALRETVEVAHDALEAKQKERTEIIRRVTNLIDDEIEEKLTKVLALVSGEAADLLIIVRSHIHAIAHDVDDIPTMEEQVEALAAVLEETE